MVRLNSPTNKFFFSNYTVLFSPTTAPPNTLAHPASAGKPPLHASSPLFGPDFGSVRGTRRKGMGAPAKVQLKSLVFPLSTKTEKPFLTPFSQLYFRADPVVVAALFTRLDFQYRWIAALFTLDAILCRVVGSLEVCGVFVFCFF